MAVVGTLKWRGHDLHVCLLLEFQSTIEPYMAARWLSIIGSFLEDQVRYLKGKRAVHPDDSRLVPLPLVIPILIYSGKSTWWPPTRRAASPSCC